MKCINGWTKEKMINHIKKEFKGKSSDGRNCFYRGLNGTKCAVGMFIPDYLYRIKMDKDVVGGMSSSALLMNYPELKTKMPLEKMYELQSVHDDSEQSETLTNILNYIENNVK